MFWSEFSHGLLATLQRIISSRAFLIHQPELGFSSIVVSVLDIADFRLISLLYFAFVVLFPALVRFKTDFLVSHLSPCLNICFVRPNLSFVPFEIEFDLRFLDNDFSNWRKIFES